MRAGDAELSEQLLKRFVVLLVAPVGVMIDSAPLSEGSHHRKHQSRRTVLSAAMTTLLRELSINVRHTFPDRDGRSSTLLDAYRHQMLTGANPRLADLTGLDALRSR